MLILSIGMPRAGSGWYYNLTHDLIIASGGQDARQVRKQYHLGRILTEVNCNIGALTPRRLGAVMIPSLLGNTFVVKAHAGPTPAALSLIRRGRIRPAYIYRDPRDALLSAYDNGQRALEKGRPNAFSHLTDWEGVEPLFCTRNEEGLAKLQAQYRVPLGTTRLEALLDWQPQAAFVLASTSAHAGIASELLSAGVDVYLEKPAASSGAEARSLAEQADSLGRILMVGFNRRYAPLHRQARHLWGGRATGIAVLQKHRSKGFHPTLRQHYTEELVHVVDMLRYFCGEGQAVQTLQQSGDGKFTGVASMVALVSGGIAMIHSSMRAGHWKEQYTLHGEGASLYIDAFSQVVLVEAGEQRAWEETYASSWKTTLKGRGFQDEIAHFLECVQNRSQPETSGWEALKTQQLVEELINLSEGGEV